MDGTPLRKDPFKRGADQSRTRAMEARALRTLIYLPGKAFTIMIAIGKKTGLWSEQSLFGS